MQFAHALVGILAFVAIVLIIKQEKYQAFGSCDINQVIKDNEGQLCCEGCDNACTDSASNAACYTACQQAYPAVNCNSS